MPLHSPVFPETFEKDGSSIATTPYLDNGTQSQKPHLTKYAAIDFDDGK